MTTLSTRADPPMSDGDFRIISTALREATGIALPDGKRPLVVSRLARRLRSLKLRDFTEYSALISRPDGADELGQMISALTTNVTAFFRESHHFDTLRDQVLPPLLETCRKGGKLRLWSAACSSGEEPFSMAISLLELCPEAARHDIRILATDIDPAILETARAGRYAAESLANVPSPLRDRYFKRESEARGQFYRISPDVARLVSFKPLNLTGQWPIKSKFDAIFCRNVAIYFDRLVQERLWARLAAQLTPNGVLFIGHSERVSGPAAAQLRQKGITSYYRQNVETAE